MTIQWIFASTNLGKIKEMQSLAHTITLLPLPQETLPMPEENANTFLENALLKAKHVAQYTHLPVLADDSGLCVPALGGQPGIYSARFAGKNATTTANMQKLLSLLEDKPKKAYFCCTLVLLQSHTDPNPFVAQGSWHGTLLTEPRGQQGFGYDPIFFDPHHQQTAAEMSPALKNTLSHRSKAFLNLIRLLHNDH